MLIVRCQGIFPAVGEILEAFAAVNIVQGWIRGSHNGPLLPVSFGEASWTRLDLSPRCIAAVFQSAQRACWLDPPTCPGISRSGRCARGRCRRRTCCAALGRLSRTGCLLMNGIHYNAICEQMACRKV